MNEYSDFGPDDEMIALRFGKISNVEDIKGKLLDDPLGTIYYSWAASTARLSPTL